MLMMYSNCLQFVCNGKRFTKIGSSFESPEKAMMIQIQIRYGTSGMQKLRFFARGFSPELGEGSMSQVAKSKNFVKEISLLHVHVVKPDFQVISLGGA